MPRSFLRPLALACAFVACVNLRAEVVINEIMYQPGGIPENVAKEFIELHNTGAAPVSLNQWRLTKGVNFTFAPGTSIPADGYLVVAADTAAFQAAYPGVTNVVGGWTGTLSNGGEQVQLEDAAGTARDEVTYADEGDWALRVREATFNGWAWFSAADGGGSSLELRNAAVDGNNGQNWAASLEAGGTPGAVNSTATTNIAPIIRKVKHFPVIPRSTDKVTISCELADETAAAGLSATLFWRQATSTNPPAFQSVAMTGNGAGDFSATLDERANLIIIEFYVLATDGTNFRTWPATTSEGQNANCQFQVDNEVLNGTDSYYRLILTAAENTAFNTVANSSDRQFNQTLVVWRGGETTVRYRSSMRIRGNSSRNYQFRPLRISVPSDEPWDGVTSFNVHPRSPHLQFLGMRLMQAAGVRATDAIPVELRRNGIESTTSTGNTPDFGKFVRVEDLGGEMVDNHWPNANDGNIYKKGRPDRYWRNTGWVVPPNADGLIDGWTKQNNGGANDWSDLTSFFATAQSITAPHFPGAAANDSADSTGLPTNTNGAWNLTPFSGAEIATFETVADLDQWARWFAVMTIMQDVETNISNGEDDDYAIYFVPGAGGQRRLQLIAHDLDTIYGLGDNQVVFNGRGLYDMCQTGSIFRPLLPLFGTSTVAGNAAFRAKYHTAIRELYGSVFNADTTTNPTPPFHTFVDNHLAGWVPAGTRTAIKTFATNRQAYLLGLIGAGAIPPTAPTSVNSVTSAHGDVMISEVLAHNVTAVNVGGAFPDIIELYNAGASPVDLGGRSISDDPALPRKYIFPGGTMLAAGGYLVLYADNGAVPGHLPFALANGGEGVHFYESLANGGAVIDEVVFGMQAPNLSIGRVGAGLTKWTLCTPTPEAANEEVSQFAPLNAVRINEWLGNPDYQFDDDFLELRNAAALPVALGGMSLTDDFINDPAKHALPPLSFMGPGAFLRFNAPEDFTPGDLTELSFGIDGTFGWLALIGQNGALADSVDVVSQPGDASSGRTPDGAVTIARFGLPASLATPGASNAAPPANILALMNSLRVTEIFYAPDTLEFIELQNIGATTLDLAGVQFTRGITYTFAAGTTLAPGTFIVVCKDRAAFQAQYGTGVPLAAGNYSGMLSNSGERVALEPAAPWDADILNFDYDAEWYPATNSNRSLTVVTPLTTRPGDWDQKESWTASSVLFGTPGQDGPPVITSTLTASSIVGDVFSYQIVATKFPTSYGASPLPAGLGVNTATGLISGTPTVAGTFNITLTATNPGGFDTEVLVLTVAASGPLASFAWGAISSPQVGAQPIAASLTARDAQGRTVTSYSGSVNLTAVSGSGTSSTVVITEAGQNSPDYFEVQNVSGQALDTSGWFVVLNDSTSGNPNATHTAVYNLPASVNAGQVLYRTDSPSENYFGENIFWTNTLPGWAMVVDNTGVIRDFLIWGYSAAEIASISVVKGGFTLSPSAQNAWTGASVAFPTGPNVLLRAGAEDFSTAADWTAAAASRGTQNAGLTVPFTGGSTPVPVSPTVINLANGVWTGTFVIDAVAPDVRVTASDGAGHTGVSDVFDTTQPPAPVITSPANATAVIGQPFSYQIIATNLPTAYGATNLPANLSVTPSTGLISGIPAAAGNTNIGLSATNPSGTGNGMLALQVQTDADGDGMGDAWEISFGLNPASPADATADKDGDGQSNRAEWFSGTAPNDPNSRLRILNETISGGDVQLTWTAAIGRRYRVLTRPDFVGSGSWIDLTPTPLVATATTRTWTHVGGSGGSARYYRVEIVP